MITVSVTDKLYFIIPRGPGYWCVNNGNRIFIIHHMQGFSFEQYLSLAVSFQVYFNTTQVYPFFFVAILPLNYFSYSLSAGIIYIICFAATAQVGLGELI